MPDRVPKNKRKINWIHEEFKPDPELAKPLLVPLLTISNRDFKEKFGHVSGSWRGKANSTQCYFGTRALQRRSCGPRFSSTS